MHKFRRTPHRKWSTDFANIQLFIVHLYNNLHMSYCLSHDGYDDEISNVYQLFSLKAWPCKKKVTLIIEALWLKWNEKYWFDLNLEWMITISLNGMSFWCVSIFFSGTFSTLASFFLFFLSLYSFSHRSQNAKGHVQLEMIAIDTNLWPA